ncbi:MAG: hypothetical protein ABI081_02920 [Burkholderiaceae bacterium]
MPRESSDQSVKTVDPDVAVITPHRLLALVLVEQIRLNHMHARLSGHR